MNETMVPSKERYLSGASSSGPRYLLEASGEQCIVFVLP